MENFNEQKEFFQALVSIEDVAGFMVSWELELVKISSKSDWDSLCSLHINVLRNGMNPLLLSPPAMGKYC